MTEEKNDVKIKIVEGRPSDPLLKGYTTYGLAVTKDDRTSVIEDITDDRTALKAFAEKLGKTDFELSLLCELVDDFLVERYGI